VGPRSLFTYPLSFWFIVFKIKKIKEIGKGIRNTHNVTNNEVDNMMQNIQLNISLVMLILSCKSSTENTHKSLGSEMKQ
jgi:hypothetical protein